jgi:aryl-alcohol dehydrogenase-like predicted oxidoreductase
MAKRVLKYFRKGKETTGHIRTSASNIRSSVSRQDFGVDAVRRAVERSLGRLRTDYIDIFLLHSPPVEVMADGALFEALRDLKRQGKIRHFGVSSPEAAVLAGALRVPGIAVVQTPVNPAQTGHAAQLPELQRAKIGVVANQIFLSGKLIGYAEEFARVKAELEALAAAKGISLNRLLIQSALAQPSVAAALTGTTNAAHLKENVADALATNVVSAQELAQALSQEAARK